MCSLSFASEKWASEKYGFVQTSSANFLGIMASPGGPSIRERDQLHPDDMTEDERTARARLEAEAKAKADAEARLEAMRNLPEGERLEAVLKENQELYGSVSQMRQELDALKLQGNTTERVVIPSEKPQYQHNKPTVFTGEGKYDVRTFVRAVERYLDGTKCPQSERLSVAVSYLDGKARDFWDSREQLLKMSEQVNGGPEPALTMEHFTKAMIGAFGGLDPITQTWNEYENLKQGKQSMEEYVRATEALVAKLGPINGPSEMDKIQRFKAGVHPDMRTKVATRLDGTRWTSFAELAQFSVGVWQAMKQSAVPPAESGNPRTFSQNNNKKRKYHEKSDSADVAGAKGDGGGKRSKAKSGNSGASKEKKSQEGYRQMSQDKKKELQEAKACFWCEKTGHFARDCPTRQQKKGSQSVN